MPPTLRLLFDLVGEPRAAAIGLARAAVLVCAVALMAGCSLVKLGYRGADLYTLRWLDRYADLEESQEAWAKERVRDFFAWHRTTQLPDYAQWLLNTAALLHKGPVSAAEVLALNADITTRLDTAAMRALPDLATLALQLKPAQLSAIEAKFAENNAGFRKEFLDVSIEQRQETRYKTVLWIAEVLFGRFSAEQQALIRRASDARPLVNELWLAERSSRQRDLLAALRRIQAERPPLEVVVAQLKPHAVRATGIAHIPDQVARAQAKASADHAAQLAATVVELTTPEQKQRALDKLRQWADDLTELSK